MKKGCDCLREELLEKIQNWLVSFHRLDPRYKILTFFNQVAADGADNLHGDDSDEDETDLYDLQRSSSHGNVALSAMADGTERRKSSLSASERARQTFKGIFNATSILTVWRPCSNDAMRKMMEGTGVGKGLDIKGKSAKRGLLSAFVPFLQIHSNKDKSQIQKLSAKAHMRVYFSSLESRQKAIDTITPYMDPNNADYKIPDFIKHLDMYNSSGWYGLEVSQRLFWAGIIAPQDITRDSETETGRASTPGFQDANMKTLKIACSKKPPPTPMPVVLQYDKRNALRPQTLVMAYEENGTVTPVVSDFDGFLLGWRREALWFGCNLPRDQEDLMLWCINHIENILDDKPSSDTWTVQWLEILKQEAANGFVPDIPEYGFGDPKSYGIMEKAAKKLIDTGAVRHGSECFNYYFPQEIDDYFLLVSDTLEPVPWKYVNVTELQSILSQKIKEGFVFPLNPKWILCDPGWKRVYDELMKSEALYADLSKDVWFPPHSGVRKRIDQVYKKHPYGFRRHIGNGRNSLENKTGYSPLKQNMDRGIAMTGQIAHDLASLELDQFKNTRRKHQLAQQIADAKSMGSIVESPTANGTGEGSSKRMQRGGGGRGNLRQLFLKQRQADKRNENAEARILNKRMMYQLSQLESKNQQRRNLSYTFDSERLRPELVEKIKKWIVSFYRLDPRYKILTFFNKVANEGADNMIEGEDEEDESYIYDLQRDSDHMGLKLNLSQPKSLMERLQQAFNATSILTVWRPCSNDAMRKMMEGTGVGKGLDIKGKSAQKGILSAFVPFMQIHENEDKDQIQQLYEDARMRVYFHNEDARQVVIDNILPYANTGEDTEYKIPDHIELLDAYAGKGLHGIEVNQRLFWEGYVVPQDITRSEDTVTGRASLAGFQDANMKTLKVACSKEPAPSPMPVVMQYDKGNPMRSQTLLMAYEENNTVTPVVSDFDGFLLGWRREALWFGCNLPREQEDLMMWCIDHIENILDSRPGSDSWTVQWLEILKKESASGFIPEIPEYGFGDPKSYGIMENAAKKLIDTGAVRHGSECFNYYFPQEIDDYFLLVSDTLRPVPWKYVNVTELQEILIRKIHEGFVFPLNPKWVLCDPGWKKVYDELMKSEALYADLSKDVWFPPHSGIREKIEEIHAKHPNGFCRQLGGHKSAAVGGFGGKSEYCPLRKHLERGVFMTGNMAFDLASLELEKFNQDSRKNKLSKAIREANESASLDGMAEENGEKSQDPIDIDARRRMFLDQRTEGVLNEPRAPISVDTKRLLFSMSHFEAKDLPRRNFTSLPEMEEEEDEN